MKNLKILFSLLLLLFMVPNLTAVEIANDTFTNGSLDNWEGNSYSYQNDGWLYFTPDGTGYKSYDFGSAYADEEVKIFFSAWVSSSWESSGSYRDYFNVLINNTLEYTKITGGGYFTHEMTATLDSNGRIKISFNPNTTATDEYSGIDYITINTVASPPNAISNIPDQETTTGLNYNYDITQHFEETENDSITYSTTSILPLGISLNSAGTLSGTATAVGVYSNIIITATDDDGSTDSNSFTFSVVDPSAPTTLTIPNSSGTVDTAYVYDISAYFTQTDGDTISYSDSGNLPDGLSLDSTTGVISGTPTLVATYDNIVITATDKDGSTLSNTFTITITDLQVESNGGRDFEMRTQENLFGDVKVIGNTVLCLLDSAGICKESAYNDSNAEVDLEKAPESSSKLVIPPNATIEYARIYWQGRKINGSTWDNTSKSDSGKIRLKKGSSGSYVELSANIQDFDMFGTAPIYSASADASSIVTEGDTYYVDTSSFYTHTGATWYQTPKYTDGLGASGTWVLVVIYNDPDEPTAKNITIFDGYKQVTSSADANASVTGFLTPKTGLVDSIVYVFAAEGDKYLSGTSDRIQMAGELYSTTLQDLGTFDSRIDVNATRVPDLINNNGTDIQIYNVGTANGGLGIINTNEVGANFNFTSDADVYFPSLFVFSTELYLPKLCYDYSIKQDGHYLSVDREAYPIAHLDSRISSSDLEVTVYLKNLEADIAAEGIAIRSDINETKFNQTGNIYTSNVNGSTLIDRGPPTSSTTLCPYDKNANNLTTNSGCTDGHNIRKGNGTLGDGDYVYTKFLLEPVNISGLAGVDEPLGLSLKYYIVAGGNKVEYPDYLLGSSNVPLCEPTGSYTPQWGQFNVVQSGQTTPIKNNINTQLSRNTFDTAVVFDSSIGTGDNEAPTSNINTTVLVEIIDVSAFGDINASCANPDASLSEPIFVPINFDSTTYQIDITSQPNDYYDFAVQNAAFRVWYFNDSNGSLIQNWTATTTNASKTLLSIAHLYDANTHTQCVTECANSTSVECFTCIRTNYAQPLCSRDNFSVRPESYDVHIYDVNQSLPAYTLATDPANLKNTTKVDISTLLNYDPLSAAATTRMDLAAGYNYRFDITATGHDGVLNVPGYTRAFGGTADYNATLAWDPQSTLSNCDDNSSQDLSFYIANGIMQNDEKMHEQVGDYAFSLIDISWTAVDWRDTTHHDTSTTGGFLTGEDCVLDSSLTTSTLVPLKYGCTITTDHGSDGGGRFYQNHDIAFHPYKFDMNSIGASVGINFQALTAAITPSYIYMANMFQDNYQDQNMSFHLNGVIQAIGYNGATLSNYVDGCYAKSLDFNLRKSDTTLTDVQGNTIFYQSNFSNFDENGTLIVADRLDANDTNSTGTLNISTASNYFTPGLSGSMDTSLNLNYDRNISNAINPKAITFISYDTNCTTPTNCSFYGDLTSMQTEGNITIDGNSGLNGTIVHYFGRTNAPRQRFVTPVGTTLANPAVDFIYYEVYCNGIGCDKTLLQNGTTSTSTDDPRWFVNTNHTSGFGTAGSVNQKSFAIGAGRVTGTVTSGNHPDSTNLVYDASRGYSYKTTMENNASTWLIYNKYNESDTNNEFEVEFDNSGSSWAGKHDTNTTTIRNGSSTTNRRTMW